MIQEISNSVASVPEELYNLTQLADVTLAAGKLSTTNIRTIKEYIKNEDATPASTDRNNALVLTELVVMKRYNSSDTTSEMSSTSTESPRKSLNDSGYMSDVEYFERKPPFLNMLQSSPQNRSVESESSIEDLCTTPNQSFGEQRQSSFSSSEDDSTYNYSHKIFDKRKSRKLYYQSDDSEHRNCRENGTFDRNVMIVETEDSILSVSESESNAEFSSSNKSIDGAVSGSDDVHTCPECGKKYSTSSNLARHRQTHRSLLDKKARRCPHCDKVYVSMPAFSMHVRTHNQGCECPHCGKRFSRPWLLQGHIRTHTGEKPFQCSICTKAFADKSNLRAHIQTHSNTKPHTCARCGKAFALKSYLYKHEESSCMRNHSNGDKEKNKSHKSDSARTKCLKKSSTATSSNDDRFVLIRNSKEKRTEFTQTDNDMPITQECIFLDVGSEKSYMDLTETRIETEPYSRISVIQTVSSQSPNIKNSAPLDFYQEKPVDFSPKNKNKVDYSNVSGKNSSMNEMPRQYAAMVI